MLRNIEYETIMREYQRRQTKSRHEQEDRQAEVYRTSPRFREIDNEIAALSVQKARELLMGEPSTFNLKSRIQLLAQERQRLLEQYGFPPITCCLAISVICAKIPVILGMKNAVASKKPSSTFCTDSLIFKKFWKKRTLTTFLSTIILIK